jgi:hypothetical protein
VQRKRGAAAGSCRPSWSAVGLAVAPAMAPLPNPHRGQRSGPWCVGACAQASWCRESKEMRTPIRCMSGPGRQSKSGRNPYTLHATTKPTIKIGRNDPCPCGNGKNDKHCCLKRPEAQSRVRVPVQEAPDVAARAPLDTPWKAQPYGPNQRNWTASPTR